LRESEECCLKGVLRSQWLSSRRGRRVCHYAC
jgi:hypothetical protein